VLLLGLSTGNKVGLALSAAVFAGFSLIVSMLVPRWRPQFPGRGLPLFLVVSVLLFVGMLAAVENFGKESESEAAGGKTAAQGVQVTEVEYKIRLPETTFKAGTYTFDVKNDGKIVHNLHIDGSGVQEATSDLAPGGRESLTVKLEPGSYDFFCSIPGHKQLGMDQKVTVT
jgi:plastocyanin